MHRRDLLKGGLVLGAGGSLEGGLEAGQTEPRPKAGLVIDAHCHAGHGQAMTALWNTFNHPEVILRHAEEAGIDRTIIFPVDNPTYEQANQEIARIVARYPGKFIGFAKHDPISEAGRIEKMLTREVRELGLKGLKLHKHPTREVLDTVSKLKVPVLYHPAKVADFHIIASAYPDISFIMAHLGSFASGSYSEHLAAIDIARRYPNVYLETSCVILWKCLEMAAHELPPEKLIFGSDGPDADSRVELYKIKLLKLAPDHEAKVLAGNVLRLLPA